MKKNYFLSLIIAVFAFVNINAQLTAPFTESFNSTTFPSTWSQAAATGGPWIVGGTMGYAASSITDHTGVAGSTRAWMDFSGTDDSVVMTSDTIDVSLVPRPELSFWYNNNLGTNVISPFNILFVEAFDGVSWVQLDRLQQDNQGVWSEHFYDLCSFILTGNKVLVRFRAESGGHVNDFFQDIAIDDIKVDTLRVNCFNPQGLAANNITDTSAILKWSSGCLDTAWSVKWGLAGFNVATGGTYSHVSIDSLSLSGLMDFTDYDFYVRSYCNMGDTSIWTGPFTFKTLPSCLPPMNLSVDSITSSSAILKWDAGSGPNPDTAWSVKWDTAGFNVLTSGNYVHTPIDSITISGLSSFTSYEFYVRGYCNSGDTSIWVGPFSFTTLCNFFTPPYLEDFSTYSFTTLPGCWEEADGLLDTNSILTFGNFDWTNDNYGNVVGGSNSARMNIWSTNRNDWLISPSIDLGTGSILYQIQFDLSLTPWATNASSTFDPDDQFALVISTDNGITWSDTNVIERWDTSNQPGTNDFFSFNLTTAGYTGLVKFGLYGQSIVSGADNEIHVDDFAVVPIPSCPRPNSLRTTAVFFDSVALNWVNGANDSIWYIEYGTAGFTQGTGTMITDTADSTAFGGLTPNTTYDVYLRSICSIGDSSIWIGPLSFTTPCASFLPPYTEDFTTMTFATPPSCWDQGSGILDSNSTIITGTSNWTSDGFAQVGFNGAAKLNIWNTDRRDWLISPSIDLGTGTIPYQVEFDIALNDFGSTAPPTSGALGPDDKIVLLISTDNGLSWSDTNILRQWDSTDIPSNLGEYFSFNLTAAGYTGKVRLAFYGESTLFNEDTDLTIDNFGVVQVPTCPRPLGLTFDSATQTTASMSWTNGAADSIWLLEYGPVGFTQGTGTIVTSTTSPGNITGLNHSTCYDVYLRSVCTIGDSSVWIGPARACTDCAPVVDLCEDFETANAGELPICWEKFIVTTGSSSVQVNNFGGNLAPKSVQLNAGSDATSTLILISPEMTALPSGTHRASFWLTGSFTPDTSLIVGTMTDPTNPATFTPWDTITTINNSYQQFRIPFDTYSGTDTRIAFLYNPTSTFRSLTIDDFCFEPIPSCEKAPSVQILNAGVDSTSLNIGWNIDTTQVSYIVAYGDSNFDPVTNPAGGDTVYSTTNFKQLIGLDPLTQYCVWVKAVCTNGDTSFWDGPHCGSTGCPSGVTLPYYEDFATYTSAFPLDETPQCWEEAVGGLTTSGTVSPMTESFWEPDGFANVGFQGAARFNMPTFGSREGWLLTPTFNFGPDPNVARIIEFDVALTQQFSTNAAPNGFGADDTVALVASYDRGVTWKLADVLMQWDTSNEPSNTGTHVVYIMRNTKDYVKFGFYASSSIANEGVDFHIDNFSIRDTTFVGLEENNLELTNFKIFPNPNTGVFTILNEGGANQTSVKVVDVQGRLVFDESYYFNENGRKVVDVQNLNAGVYVLLLQSEGKMEQHRIIISK